MPAKQLDGRIAQAELVAAQPIHVAWGAGLPAWDTTPEAEPTNVTSLVNELGRRQATQVAFVNPDTNGSIETPQGNFSLSATPTRYLYVRVVFGFNEEPASRIRELGVFIGTTVKAGLPAGQKYFTPDQVNSKGRMYLLDRSQNFARNGSIRPAFEYVFPF
jgi:hypothetical protein